MAERIDQNGERLFTVRPRNSPSVTEKRGTVSSIRFHLPRDTNKSKWAASVPSSVRSQFEQAVGDNGYINFIAKSVSYDIQEKSQVLHTFGGQEAIYFFGKAPIQVNFSGLLVDDLDNDQFCKFLDLYLNYLRGSKASQDYCYVELSINNATFTGAFTGISVQQTSERDTDIQFTAQFIAKTFTLASTDSIFLDNGGINQPVVIVREVDPTITQEAISETINQNFAAALKALPDDSPTANGGNSLSLGDYTRSFGTLPTVSDLLGFSASDITDFFGNINDFINNITKPIQDLANQIDQFANDVIGLVEAVEDGIDSIINNIDSAVKSVYGAIDSIEDAVTTICNFPASMAQKLGSFGSSGGAAAPPIAGSDSISSSQAFSILVVKTPAGSARGTAEGDAAVLAVSSADKSTSLSPAPKDDNEIPGLSPSLPPGDEEPTLPPDGGGPTLPTIMRIGG